MNEECTRFEELLLELAYDEIDQKTAEKLRLHAGGCDRCRQALAEIELTRRVASQLSPLEPDQELDLAILSSAREAAAKYAETGDATPRRWESGAEAVEQGPGMLERLRLLLLRPALVTACVALLVLVFTVFLKQSAPPESEGPWSAAPGAPFLGPAEPLARLERSGGESPGLASPVPAQERAPREEPVIGAVGSTRRERGTTSEPRFSPKGGAGKKWTAAPTSSLGADEALADLAAEHEPGPAAAQAPGPAPAFAGAPAPPFTPAKKTKSAPAKEWKKSDSPGLASGLGTKYGDRDDGPASASETASGKPSASFAQGRAAYRRGDCATATEVLLQVLDGPGGGGTERPAALHYLGRCEQRRGHCGKALIWYDELLTEYPAYPAHPEAVWEAAKCHRRLGHLEQATALLQKLTQVAGWSAKAEGELEQIAAEPAGQGAASENSPE